MDTPVRWGILSTARINRLVIPGLQESPETELVAVASRDRVHATEYAREWGIPRAHGSYEALLDDPEVDAVYISLPNGPHVEWSVRALDAGKHVLCEKPLTRNPDEAERAFDAADRNERLLMEAFMWRYHPQTRRLVALLEEIGPVERIEARFGFTADEGNVRLSRELDGGALMDVGCYCVSSARLVAGEPLEVSGEQRTGGDGVDVHFEGRLVFPGGVEATFECGLDMEDVDTLEVFGKNGSVFLDDPWHGREPVLVVNGREIREEPIDPYRAEVENLSRAACGLEAPLLGRADAVGQARAIAALYRSAETGEVASPT